MDGLGHKKKMSYFPGAEINWFSIPYTNHLIYFFNVMFLLIKKKHSYDSK